MQHSIDCVSYQTKHYRLTKHRFRSTHQICEIGTFGTNNLQLLMIRQLSKAMIIHGYAEMIYQEWKTKRIQVENAGQTQN